MPIKKPRKKSKPKKSKSKTFKLRFEVDGDKWHCLYNPTPTYSEAGKSTPDTPLEVADLAECFIEYVKGFLFWRGECNAIGWPPPDSPEREVRVRWARKASECCEFISAHGPILASALEHSGFDSTAVLYVVNGVDLEGDRENDILPKWMETKIALQQAALKLRPRGQISKVWTELQYRILEELHPNHRGAVNATAEYLAGRLDAGVTTVKEAIKSLQEADVVANKRGLGYYRLDEPLPNPGTDTPAK